MRCLRQISYDLSIEISFLNKDFKKNIGCVVGAIGLQYWGVLSPVTTHGSAYLLIVSCLHASFKLRQRQTSSSKMLPNKIFLFDKASELLVDRKFHS